MTFDLLFDSGTLRDKNRVVTSIFILFLSSFSFVFLDTQLLLAASDDSESPKRVIQVKDYTWREGGMGRAGVMDEITLENIGKNDYENLEIEVDFYTTNDIPLGSLRSTIKDVIQSGTKKTFKNINFGIMHSELQKTIVRVVGAEKIETGTPGHPRDLIVVKNWEWAGGQYGTEGILKEITLENRSKNNYSNIKLEVQYLGIPGAKVGTKGHTERTVIHDILPANKDRTYTGINVGFRHPDARNVEIAVTDADKISVKELRYRLAKKGETIDIGDEDLLERKKKKTLAERYREEQGIEDISEERVPGERDTEISKAPDTIDGKERSQRSLAERYQSEVLKRQLTEQPQLSLVDRYKQRILQESDVDVISPTYSGITEPIGPRYTLDDISESQSETEEKSQKTSAVEQRSKPDKESAEEEIEYEDEVPIPKRDIIVKDFKLGGAGVPQSMGELSTLTLENISGISYSKIVLEVAFYLFQGNTPMGSHRITLYEVMPPHSEREFKNVKMGMLSEIPDVVRVNVVEATAVE